MLFLAGIVLAASVLVPAGIGGGTISGTSRSDFLRGTSRADEIYGRSGNDTIVAGRGNDRVYGGAGNDRLYGGGGADRIHGGPGRDRLAGGLERDRLYGGSGGDRFRARGGDRDLVRCGLGRDIVVADARDVAARSCEVVRVPGTAALLAAGDIADCSSSGDEATAAILDAYPHARIATLGDNAYPGGTPDDFARCYDPSWGRHKARTRPSPGNHEYHTANASGYFAYFGAAAGRPSNGYYSYDLGTWHVISLNSERDVGAAGAQVAWLKRDLAATRAACVLAYWHRPRFSRGQYSDSSEVKPFWDALSAANADVVLNGHDHNYQRYRLLDPSGAPDSADGLHQFVVGTGGRSHYRLRPDPRRQRGNDDTFGVLKLELRPGRYEWEFVPRAGGRFRDRGSASCR